MASRRRRLVAGDTPASVVSSRAGAVHARCQRSDAPHPWTSVRDPARAAAHAAVPDWAQDRSLYRQPVSYVRLSDGSLATPGGGRWTRNLVERKPVPIRLLGRDITATPELISDPELVDALLEAMMQANPATSRFVHIPRDENGRLNRSVLENVIHYGFRVVRWHLNPDDSPKADQLSQK